MNMFKVNTDDGWKEFLTFEAAKAFAEKLSWDTIKPVEIHCPSGKIEVVDVNK
jgi:hypothetical protein